VGRAIMLEFMSSNTLSEMLDDFYTLKRGRISERLLAAGGDGALTIRAAYRLGEACSTASPSPPYI